jgi:prepilin-type N-terminal cleavage/methylation domain-containing protein
MLRDQRGVSIVEVMVALIVMGIGLMAAMRALPESSVKTTRSRNMTTAVNIAQEKIEELMGMPYGAADLAGGDHDDPTNPIRGRYLRTWTIADNTPVAGMKAISVSVTFPTASADSTATLRTFKTVRQ